MPEPSLDVDRLPTGQRGWAELVRALAATDDRIERHYLEMKSKADLTTKIDRSKVAKFILGAGNRMPDRAARYLDGHAIMVLGVAHEQLTSVPPFEAHELEQYVAKFTGTPGPTWDHQWVPVDGADVVVITVDPPRQGDPIWPCMAADDRLHNGSIYIRADGATRPANGAEVRLLGERAATLSANAQLDVSIVGSVVSARCDPELLDTYIDRVRIGLLNAHAVTQRDGPLSGLAYSAADIAAVTSQPEDRTYEEYEAEIDTWADQVRQNWPNLVVAVLAAMAPRTLVRVKNLGEAFLEDLRVDVHIAGDVDGLEAEPTQRMEHQHLLPAPPREWGPRPNQLLGQLLVQNFRPSIPDLWDVPSPRTDGRITFNNNGSVDIEATFDELRPRDIANSDANDLVLVTPDDSNFAFAGTWRVTTRGHNTVYEGELTLHADHDFDLTGEVRRLVMPND